ncbi:hypothetical protein BJQ94_11060 [Cryobacterium sp. SO2]|uniref:hypothetical protein n=1 Tax=Cryobacterium sp. SO2 TaxID=1897060 RepID=UPI00223E4F82|nr:hypothetical protein [Cryobacterium sp. SO2]WEO75919.1 hypothetical protein BJQ94_11060 [Cryobacterium sp. SO2]
MRKITFVTLALAGSAALVGATTLPAFAADTTATVEVSGGLVSIAAPATIAFTTVAPGAPSTATLAGVVVTDARAGVEGWVANVTLADFTGTDTADTIPAAGATYTAGTAVVVGTATVAPSAAGDPAATLPVQTATAVTGNNTATWSATLSVPVPTDALSDTFTAVLTHSVV